MINKDTPFYYKAAERMPGGGTTNVYKVNLEGITYAIKVSPFSVDKEVKVYEVVGSHPNILQVVQKGRISLDTSVIPDDRNSGTWNAIVFSFIEQNLSASEKQLSPKEKLTVVQQLLAALSFIHSKGVTHNDLKPDDVLVSGQNEIITSYLADFNLAKIHKLPDEENTFLKLQQNDYRKFLEILIQLFNVPETAAIKSDAEMLKNQSTISLEELGDMLKLIESSM